MNGNKLKRIVLRISICIFACGFLCLLLYLANKPFNDEADRSVDYDLTAMSKDMAYAQLCQIKNLPEEYAGKTIKIAGTQETVGDMRYITVYDGLGCCNVSMSFVAESYTAASRIQFIATISYGQFTVVEYL